MSKKIVYVTGCLGFIGGHVTWHLLSNGYYVIGVDKMTYAAQPHVLEKFKKFENHFKFIKSDINDLDKLHDCDYVINCAAETHVDNSILNSKEFLHSNINGVKHLLDLIRQKGQFKMPTLLHFSTDEVYGDIESGSHTETDLLKPSNPYAATKAAADMLVLAWARTFNVPYIIVRPTNNYGFGQYVEKLIPKTCKYFNLGKKIPLHNDGKPTRVWLNAKDTAEAILTIIDSGKVNEIFNISGTEEYRNIDIVKKIYKLIIPPSNNPVEFDNWIDFNYSRNGQDVRYSLDDTKLRNLGWNNKYFLENELPEIVKYYNENFIW